MTALRLRVLFAVAVLLLPVQVLFRAAVDEPYPGLYQPSFGGVPQEGTEAATVEPKVTVTYVDGSVEAVPFAEILPQGGPTARSLLFRSAFLTEERAQDPRTLELVARRLEERAGHPATSMRVDWQDVRYDLRTGERRVVSVTSTVKLDLQETT